MQNFGVNLEVDDLGLLSEWAQNVILSDAEQGEPEEERFIFKSGLRSATLDSAEENVITEDDTCKLMKGGELAEKLTTYLPGLLSATTTIDTDALRVAIKTFLKQDETWRFTAAKRAARAMDNEMKEELDMEEEIASKMREDARAKGGNIFPPLMCTTSHQMEGGNLIKRAIITCDSSILIALMVLEKGEFSIDKGVGLAAMKEIAKHITGEELWSKSKSALKKVPDVASAVTTVRTEGVGRCPTAREISFPLVVDRRQGHEGDPEEDGRMAPVA